MRSARCRAAKSTSRRSRSSCPGNRTKGGVDHIIPLSPLALSILTARTPREDSDFVFGRGEGGFSGWSQCKARLDARLDLEPWVLHDFRRALSTTMHERLDVAAAYRRSHPWPYQRAQGGVAGTYNRAQYLDQRRDALETLRRPHQGADAGAAVGGQVDRRREVPSKPKPWVTNALTGEKVSPDVDWLINRLAALNPAANDRPDVIDYHAHQICGYWLTWRWRGDTHAIEIRGTQRPRAERVRCQGQHQEGVGAAANSGARSIGQAMDNGMARRHQ